MTLPPGNPESLGATDGGWATPCRGRAVGTHTLADDGPFSNSGQQANGGDLLNRDGLQQELGLAGSQRGGGGDRAGGACESWRRVSCWRDCGLYNVRSPIISRSEPRASFY